MKLLSLAAVPLLSLSFAVLAAQAPAPAVEKDQPAAAEPLIVDVHPSPYRAAIYANFNFGKQRFDMRDATLLSVISEAYNREYAAILGGPTWIDFDRFDVAVKLLPTKPASDSGVAQNTQTMQNPLDPVRPILKRVLTERFHLTYHFEDRPLPGYVMTAAKDGTKLTEAKDPTATGNCEYAPIKVGSPGQGGTITCTSQSIAKFIASYAGLYPHPVIDRTGLTKTYDFSLKLAFANLRSRELFIRAYTEVFRQQLGLIVTAADVMQPAMVVDKVDRTPTPTPPEIAKQIPAPPDLEFEVATIKPAAESEPRSRMQFNGSQITYGSYSLQELLVSAWDLRTGAMIGNKPVWLDQVRYTMLVKLPPEVDARTVFEDRDQLTRMQQKLLIDRFQIKYHWGADTQDGWALLPGAAKMKRADPASRTTCAHGPPPGEKDVLSAPDSPYDQEFYCRNVTMAQFAELAQSLAGSEVKNRVSDKTGLEGSYDFTVFYSSSRMLRAAATAADAAAKQPGNGAADPVSGMSLQDAIRKQLGLRLERQPQTVQALILDHIEQTPTAN